jgi:SAM-dependent methyltransferase
MGTMLRVVVKELAPPILYRGLRRLAHWLVPPPKPAPKAKAPVVGEEKTAEWYDAVYQHSAKYARHYSESGYYFMWTVIADRLRRQGVRRILDLGCGPGQFARLLHDQGFRHYCGVDLSSTSVELARRQCPEFEFIVADLLQDDVLARRDYDCLIALEFLEHVHEDLTVLGQVKRGTRFIGSVPSFPSAAHVRHFTSVEQVEARYGSLFSGFQVDVMIRNPKGTRFYLMEGIKL